MSQIKIVKQHNQRDCGAACLSMIAAYYGLHHPLSKYRELTKTDKTGTNIYGIVDAAKQIGLAADALSGTPTDLLQAIESNEIHFPFIAHTISDASMLHYVVVFKIEHGIALIGDPDKGKYRLPLDQLFERCTDYYISFKKTIQFQTGNYEKGNFYKFFGLLKGQYIKLAGVLLISLIVTAIGIMGAFIFELAIDNFSTETGYYESEDSHTHENESDAEECESAETNEDINLLESFMLLFSDYDFFSNFNLVFILVIGLYLLQAAIQFIRGYLIISVSRTIDLRLTLSYYTHIVGLPVSSITSWQTGEYLSRFSDADNIRHAISEATLTIILDSIMVIACGIILYLENLYLFLLSFVMVALYAVLLLLYRKPIDHANHNVMEDNAIVQSYLKESIDGIETVKAASAEECVKEKTSNIFHQFLNSVVKKSFLSMTQDTLADTVELIGTVCILWLGFSMVLAGTVTIGSLVTFYVLLSYFTQPIKNLIELQPTIQTAFVAAERLTDILNLEQEDLQHSNESAKQINEIKHLDFQNIFFRYGNRELTLNDIGLSIRKGEKIAIVGESGSGKTTLAKLLLRFYDPEQGTILINGQNIRDISPTALRKQIAYVDQNTFLFSDTIKNNLKLGNSQITDDEIEQVCKVCHADQFIRDLPTGYETSLEENGANLSGGQRQRIAIARALLRKPQLLILDEATSNLDTITEAAIRNTISQFNDDLTCIIIAHRLSTVKTCDRIYVMEHGKIIESGTHDALISQNGAYTALWNMT